MYLVLIRPCELVRFDCCVPRGVHLLFLPTLIFLTWCPNYEQRVNGLIRVVGKARQILRQKIHGPNFCVSFLLRSNFLVLYGLHDDPIASTEGVGSGSVLRFCLSLQEHCYKSICVPSTKALKNFQQGLFSVFLQCIRSLQ